MEVISAEWNYHNGQPNLALTLDDGHADVYFEQRILPYAPLVYLGGDWEDRLAPLVRDVLGAEMTLRGFTDDAVVVQLARAFVAAGIDGTWSPRRLELPHVATGSTRAV